MDIVKLFEANAPYEKEQENDIKWRINKIKNNRFEDQRLTFAGVSLIILTSIGYRKYQEIAKIGLGLVGAGFLLRQVEHWNELLGTMYLVFIDKIDKVDS